MSDLTLATEKMRRCLAKTTVSPERVMAPSPLYGVCVNTAGLDDAEQRVVWRAFRLVDPDGTPDRYEDWTEWS